MPVIYWVSNDHKEEMFWWTIESGWHICTTYCFNLAHLNGLYIGSDWVWSMWPVAPYLEDACLPERYLPVGLSIWSSLALDDNSERSAVLIPANLYAYWLHLPACPEDACPPVCSSGELRLDYDLLEIPARYLPGKLWLDLVSRTTTTVTWPSASGLQIDTENSAPWWLYTNVSTR